MSQPPPPNEPPNAGTHWVRFAALVRRELGAIDVSLLEPGAATVDAPNVLYATLGDGGVLAVTFADAPADRDVTSRRLEMLAGTFSQTAHETEPARTRFTVAHSLHDELRALSTRAQAVEALVLDAHSPIVWGSATHRAPHEEPEVAELRLAEPVAPAPTFLHDDDGDALDTRDVPVAHAPSASELHIVGTHVVEESSPDPLAPDPSMTRLPSSPDGPSDGTLSEEDEELGELARRAIREVRALPEVPNLHKGKTLHHHERTADFGYVSHSFAGIYLIVLVFDTSFDEIRAERALQDALPRIERLVLALPPLDPTPEPRANVVSLRRRRR